MKLIVIANPKKDTHSYKFLSVLEKEFKKKDLKYEVVDLYEENFDPVLSEKDFESYSDPTKLPKDILSIQSKIKKSDTLIFIYPVWWYSVPAVLKGFIDRVFTSGFAFKFSKKPKILMFCADILSRIPGLRYALQPYVAKGLLKNKRAVVIRTYGGPKAGSRIFDRTEKNLENALLRFCGITKIKVLELFNLSVLSKEKEDKFIKKIKSLF